MAVPAIRDPSPGWRASLSLSFERRNDRTILASRRHQGPLVVQKPFYPEPSGVCHVTIVHPPGGVVGGDELDLALDLEAGAGALVTTPGAAKLYRSAGPQAALTQRFRLTDGSTLEWLPQETIVHDGAVATMETDIELDGDARFAGWEIVCLGLPASGVPFASGRFRQGLCLRRDGAPLLTDRCLFAGGDAMLAAPWGLGGHTVCGLFVATLPETARMPDLPESDRAAFGTVDGLLLGRYGGHDAWEAKRVFAAAWALWREAAMHLAPCPPRIWNT